MAGNGARDGRLIWIDLEMTGLDTDRDSIIEIATAVTDSELNILADGPELAISHPLSTLEAMDDWNRSEETRVGQECVSTCTARRSTFYEKKKYINSNT